MTTAALIADLRSRGVTLVPDGDLLRCRPKSSLTEDDLVALSTNKPEVLRLLRKEEQKATLRIVCHSCRSRRFWRSTQSQVICAVCHPPAADHLIADWIDAGPPPSKGWLDLGNLSDEVVRARIARLRRLNADGSDPAFGE